jgi:alpha-beta hydrolase superfamily lysophospholipase
VIRSVVIEVGRDTVRGHHHLPPAGEVTRAPVLMCPPFGWEDMCSYRARRRWAELLAEAGHPVLRFDLPGTGDSTGSPHDADLLQAWSATVQSLAVELAAASETGEIAAIGIGLGGLLALRAADLGAPIGQVALWGVPPSGARLIRELRASAALIPPPVGAPPVDGADGWLELTGYLLTESTGAALRAVDLSDGRTGAPRRVLLLGRDGIAVDPTFIERLRAAGAEVTLADGMGFGPMMADPEKARIPEETIEVTVGWLGSDPAPAVAPTSRVGTVGRGEPLVVSVADARLAERAIVIPAPGGDVFGVLCAPDSSARGQIHAPVAAVLLNGAAQRHIGQNRNWVETARRWAAQGIPSLRLDLPGIGDAGGQGGGPIPLADFYGNPNRVEQLRAGLEWLRSEGIADRFLVAGLCAGAYWAYQAALVDEAVVGLGLINLRTFAWSSTIDEERSRRATVRALRGDIVGKLRHDKERRAAIARSLRTLTNVRALAEARRGQQEYTARVGTDIERLNARGCEVGFLIGEQESLLEELRSFRILERLPQWSRVSLQRFDWEDHAVRALASQRLVADWLDRLLERVAPASERRDGVASTSAG